MSNAELRKDNENQPRLLKCSSKTISVPGATHRHHGLHHTEGQLWVTPKTAATPTFAPEDRVLMAADSQVAPTETKSHINSSGLVEPVGTCPGPENSSFYRKEREVQNVPQI